MSQADSAKVGKEKKFYVKIADVALLLKPLSILSTFGIWAGQSLENLLFFEPMQNTWCKKSLDFNILAKNLFLQGISHWTGHYELALTDRNIQVESSLKVILDFWD